jgi:hypothetical protein
VLILIISLFATFFSLPFSPSLFPSAVIPLGFPRRPCHCSVDALHDHDCKW